MEKNKLKRKLYKSILYRIVAFTAGQFLAFVLFKRIELNVLVGMIDGIQTIIYFLFELEWDKYRRKK